jgi:hypothetical protein
LETLVDRFQMINPKWLENHRMGRWNRGTKKTLRYYRRYGKNGIRIPRGYARQLLLLLKREGLAYQLNDRRRLMAAIDVSFQGTLKPFQSDAVTQMGKRDFGTLSAATGSGKTVMGLALIAHRRQPTVVVVHTKELAFQWIQRIEQFLGPLIAGSLCASLKPILSWQDTFSNLAPVFFPHSAHSDHLLVFANNFADSRIHFTLR